MKISVKHILFMSVKSMIVLLLFSFFITTVHAQNNVVQGSIKDENTAQSLEDASIALYKVEDSLLSAGTVTKSGGIFEIRKVKPGSYYLVVRFIGYKNKIISNIDLNTEQKKDLGTILLYPFKDFISSVTVSAESANAINKIDKQVYKADQFQSAKGGTAIDVLKNMPSVAVNESL